MLLTDFLFQWSHASQVFNKENNVVQVACTKDSKHRHYIIFFCSRTEEILCLIKQDCDESSSICPSTR